jgi:hypothetical protein
MNGLLDQNLELFFGECNAAVARVYAKLPLEALANSWKILRSQVAKNFRLKGTISGPNSQYAHTLSATIPFTSRVAEQALILEGTVPDPCFWTPDEPYLYHVACDLSQVNATGGPNRSTPSPASNLSISVGLRPLGAKEGSLYFAGKRWVPRGWVFRAEQPIVVEQAHQSMVALASTDGWNEASLTDAAKIGAFAVQLIRNESDAATCRSLQLGRQPAVGMLAFDATSASPELGYKYGSAILAQWLRQPPPWSLAPWAQAVLVELGDLATLAAASQLNVPVLIYRPQPQVTSAGQARAACDVLQRNAAMYGDFAGYFV